MKTASSEQPDPEHSLCSQCSAPMTDGLCLVCAAEGLDKTFFRGKTPTHAPDQPIIEGWEIQELISLGGMGEIWLAHREGDPASQAALKVPAARLAGEESITRRFEMEAEILAGLQHPNILKVLDIDITRDGRLFIATEYIEGSDLRQLLRAERIPRERALDIFSKVSEAIEYAHREKIIHRDLKPTNLLVSADGTVKVADFGLAKQLGTISTAVHTSQGDGLGTPYYLAPESLKDAASADERADVYALGVLLYEMLSGKLPLGTYQPLSSLGFSKSWDEVIRRALQQDPKDRFASVQEFHQAVRRLRKKQETRSQYRRWQKIALVPVALGAAVGLGFLLNRPAKPETIVYRKAVEATLAEPWRNSLGMEFVPIPKYENLLMCRTETSLSQYLIFQEERVAALSLWYRDIQTGKMRTSTNRFNFTPKGWRKVSGRDFEDLGFPQTGDSPIGSVSSADAETFCNWLTLRERKEGRLSESQYYRLPTVAEWQEAARTSDLAQANHAREEVREFPDWPPNFRTSSGRDPYIFSAPVQSGPPNDLGIYHLLGNQFEWVTPGYEVKTVHKHGRIGGSWSTPSKDHARPQHKGNAAFSIRRADNGFRCVLDLQAPSHKP